MFAGYEAQPGCKVILSHHNYESTPDDEELEDIIGSMFAAGADIAKVAAMARDITDAFRMLALNKRASGEGDKYTRGEG